MRLMDNKLHEQAFKGKHIFELNVDHLKEELIDKLDTRHTHV